MPDASRTPAWCGWVRPAGGAWRQACAGRDHGHVWDQLLAHVVAARHVERLVLPAGEHPATRRKRRR